MSSYLIYDNISIFEMFLFILMYFMSFHLVMGVNNWFLIWLGLEVNMMMFIVLIFKRHSMWNVESCLKYFFIQSLGSVVFMVLFYFNKMYLSEIMCLILSFKVGAGPFFYWFPSLCSGISWLSCFVLMTVQKLMPLMLMSMFISWIMFFIMFVSLTFGVLGSFNQKDFKQLVGYSSIYHLGWIMMCMMYEGIGWINYLFIYGIMIFPIICLMWWLGVVDFMSIVSVKWNLFVVLMLSMAGMPPFLGFFLKWFAFLMTSKLNFIVLMIMVISSVIMFYVYFRMMYDILMEYKNSDFMFEVSSMDNFKLDMFSILGILFGLCVGICLMF